MVVRHGGKAEDGGVGNDARKLDKVHSHPEGTEAPWKNFHHGSHRRLGV